MNKEPIIILGSTGRLGTEINKLYKGKKILVSKKNTQEFKNYRFQRGKIPSTFRQVFRQTK